MNGNFNGIRLRNISSRNTYSTGHGTVLETIRVTEYSEDLETELRLGATAVLILADGTIEGTIVGFTASILDGYEITIEA